MPDARAQPVDMVVVGAGFAGLYMLHRARGMGLVAQGIEAAEGVGGTWWWNRYPGARCDIESLEYSYSFDDELQQSWEWTERYATQPEILRYLEHVADRFDLRRDIRFGTRVTAARWDDEQARWTVETDAGPAYDARFVVMATGCLSVPLEPDIPGRDDFTGPTYLTGRWPRDGVDLTGLRVGVIGTGSSAIQAVPLMAAQAAQLTVFQRTPNYSVPAGNRPLDPARVAEVKADYAAFRAANRAKSAAFGSDRPDPVIGAFEVSDEQRRAAYEERWDAGLAFLGAFTDLMVDPAANATAAEFVRDKIAAVVEDPDLAALLSPTQMVGCKRMCLDSGYYETFNLPHVSLVDLRTTPIETITPTGVRTRPSDAVPALGSRWSGPGNGAVASDPAGDGCDPADEYELDVLVLATGFDAMTGALSRIEVRGRDGLALGDAWAAGPRTYLGLMVHGFPNLFTVTGPGSPSVLTNMVVSIEHHVDWIADAVAHLDGTGRDTIEAEAEAQDQWVDYVNAVASFTIFPTCNSWYLGANVPGKTRVFMPLPGFPGYAAQVADATADDYRGFVLS